MTPPRDTLRLRKALEHIAEGNLSARNMQMTAIGALRASAEAAPGPLEHLLIDILTSAEYEKMAAEGRAADALGLVWDESTDRYARLAAAPEDAQ